MTGPSSASVTRRTALFITGASATVALSACAPKVRPLADSSASASGSSSSSSSSASAKASASASASSGKSYKGPLKFDNYEKNGTYVPATETEKARNVPKPLPPTHMNDRSVDGIYSFLGYWISSINYVLLTGDSEPLSQSDQDYVEIFKRFSDMYEDKSGWMYGSDAPMSISLYTDVPTQTSSSSSSRPRYRWNGRLNLDQNLKIYVEGKGSASAFTAKSHDIYIDMTYKDGGWTVITKDTSDDDSGNSGSSDASPSPSSKSPKSGSGKSGGLSV